MHFTLQSLFNAFLKPEIISYAAQQADLGPVSPTVVNFNRRFSPHFNLQLAYIRFTNAS